MQLARIAVFKSPFATKFGVPRQSGLVSALPGHIVFEPQYRDPEALRGLEGYDYLWIVWGFSANVAENSALDSDSGLGNALGSPQDSKTQKLPNSKTQKLFSPTVRPPVLGGNVRMGVWATRSPYRPNPLGLSSVRIDRVEADTPDGPVIHVLGADLMDGTPIYDIKPYVAYSDAHPDARSGFADGHKADRLEVVFARSPRTGIADSLDGGRLSDSDRQLLVEVLACDPRPRYHDDPDRIYGMPFMGCDVKFRVCGRVLTILSID